MTRYFPELVAAATAELPERCVIDGEVIIATDHGLDFEALQQRIHPANSRVPTLAEQTPASFMAFCVRAVNDRICLERGKGPRCGFSPWVTA
jgi:ATP-dependent DNA ligase